MNIFNKVAFQGLLKNRTRTIVTIIGVILSAAMITGVASLATSLQQYMINGSIMKYGDWHIGLSDVDNTFIEQQTKDSRIANIITFENLGYAKLEKGKNENKPYLFVAGFNQSSYDQLPITLTSGRLPENDTEIIISSHLKDNAEVDISIGDVIELKLGSRVINDEVLTQYDPFTKNSETLVEEHKVSYTVVGKYKRPAFENVTSPGYTLITTKNSANESNSYSAFIKLNKPQTVHAYENELQINHKTVLNDDVLRFMGLSKDKTFNTLLYSVGAILVALIMLGSIFLIYNAFTISLNERMRQFGILLSVGATENQLRNSVLFEGLCIGLVGIPIGVLVGIPTVSGVLSLVSKNFNNFAYSGVPLELHVSLPIILCTIAISFITILVSAYIPAHKSAKTPVMTCIRQTNEIKVEMKEIEIAKWVERLLGLERTLALKNFKRNKRRYRTIVLSLVLSVVMFVSASAFKTTLQQAAESSNISTDYDLLFFSESMKEDEASQLFEKFQNVEGVYEGSYQAMVDYSTHVSANNLTSYFIQTSDIELTDEAIDIALDVQFIEDRLYFDFLKKLGFDPAEYTGDNAKVVAIAKILSKDTTEYVDVFTKQSMSFVLTPMVKGDEQLVTAYPVEMNFVDTYSYDPLPVQPSKVKPYTFMVVVPYQQIEQWGLKHVQIDRGLTFQSNNTTASVAEMEKIAQEQNLSFDYRIYNANEIFEQNRNIIFIIDLFTIVFVLMISLIAVANIFNTISTNIRLRRRELAMLRSIGMSDRDFNKMMRFECASYGIQTLVFSIPISIIFSWLIYKGMFSGGAEVQYVFPWTSMIISISSVFLIIFITTMYALNRIRKENIIDALRDDMN